MRAPQTPPQGPKSPNFLLMVKPLINWKGEFVPCVGAGPGALAAFAFCDSHFKPFGWIKLGDFGATGFTLYRDRTDAAVVKAVESESPATKADIRVGDEIVEVEGKPLTASAGEAATQQLFGKAGTQFHITVQSAGIEKTVVLTLAPKPKS